MGYAQYTLPDGREAGYAVEDVCNRDDCHEKIDRGLGHLCGELPGDERGCGKYFCSAHLYYLGGRYELPHINDDGYPAICDACHSKVIETQWREPLRAMCDRYGIPREWLIFDPCDDLRVVDPGERPNPWAGWVFESLSDFSPNKWLAAPSMPSAFGDHFTSVHAGLEHILSKVRN
jgi:hypothetical protein